jgi:hypothetical protein
VAKKKGQKHKQRSTKHTHKDRETRTPLINGAERRCSGMVSSSCSTSGLTDFGYPFGFLSPTNFYIFQSFYFQRIRGMLFQKSVVRIRLDFYVFITVTLSIPLFAGGLLVFSSRVAYARSPVTWFIRHWNVQVLNYY